MSSSKMTADSIRDELEQAQLFRELEGLRGYLRVIARLRLPSAIAARVDASDVIQSAFVEAWKEIRAEDCKITQDNLRGWLRTALLYKILKAYQHETSECRDVRRSLPLDPALEKQGAERTASELAQQHETREALESAVAALDELDRDYVKWMLDDKSYAEMARIRGVTPGATRKGAIQAVERVLRSLDIDLPHAEIES
jgi:RNA polymerase sigma factor (sigma-70 family)